MKKTSVFLSLVLRHKPEAAGVKLDRHGWADVQALIAGVNGTGKYQLDMEKLRQIVKEDSKQRYSFNEDQTKIRANQGHSIDVDVELKKGIPPVVLYHGTAEKSLASIREKGLLPQNRLYVHLSKDIETAIKVGERHGKAVVLKVDIKKMVADGYDFYLSANGVWLTKEVPAKYLKVVVG